MSSPPVPVVDPPEPPQPLTLVCANCHAALSGEYCAACGQRHEPHVHTVAHFAGEALESVSHADSRLWRTLWYLLSRPGFLTREFFAGRRVRYLPPFRLYLVISVVFFLVVGLPDGATALIVDDDTASRRCASRSEYGSRGSREGDRTGKRRSPRWRQPRSASRPTRKKRRCNPASRWSPPTASPAERDDRLLR